jgi:hypothetical protein
LASLGGEALILLKMSPDLNLGRRAQRLVGERGRDCASITRQGAIRRLRRTPIWDEAQDHLVSRISSEEWSDDRDPCWRYLTFPARCEDTAVTAVFSVYLGGPPRRSPSGVALVKEDTPAVVWQRGPGVDHDRESADDPRVVRKRKVVVRAPATDDQLVRS